MTLARRDLIGGAAAALAVGALAGVRGLGGVAIAADGDFPVKHSDAEWRKLLPPESYAVLRHEATERPFSSPLLNEHRAGTFSCLGCNNALFSSKTKFESGTGWPSFWAPLSKTAVAESRDSTLGMVRTEIHCPRCGGHLGHVFDDGPKPTGLRYCMNGVALKFTPAQA